MTQQSEPLTLDRARIRPDHAFGLLLSAVYLVLLIPRIILHVPWRDEWQAWMLVTDKPPLPTLFGRLAYEGHPYLWHIFLWLGAHVWNDASVLKIAHTVFATLTVYLLATFAPLPRWQRVLLAFSYFLAFEYAVISRNYSIGVLFLFAFAAVRTWQPRATIAAALMLALAAQTNALAGMIAAVIAGWAGVRWLTSGRPGAGRFVVAMAIVALGLALAALQLHSPPDRNYTATTYDISVFRVAKMVAAQWRSFVPLPSITRAWWATNLLDFSPKTNPLNGIQSLLGVVTFCVAWWILPAKRWLRTFWVAGAGVLLAFGYFKFTGSLRHHGTFFIYYIVLYWLGQAPQTDGETPTAVPCRGRRLAWAAILVLQCLAGVSTAIADTLMPFSASRVTADYIRKNYPDAAVIGQVDFSASAVTGVLGKPVFYPSPGRWGTYLIWDYRRNTYVLHEQLTQAGLKLTAQSPGRPVILVLSDDAVDLPDEACFHEVARFQDSTEETERYRVYTFDPVAAATRPVAPLDKVMPPRGRALTSDNTGG